MTYSTGFEAPAYEEDDEPRIDPQRCTAPGHDWRTNKSTGSEYCFTCFRELKIREGTWRDSSIQGGTYVEAGPIKFDDAEIVEGVSITRAEAQCLIEFHYGAAKVRIDRASFDPTKTSEALLAIRGHFDRAENIRQALYPGSPPQRPTETVPTPYGAPPPPPNVPVPPASLAPKRPRAPIERINTDPYYEDGPPASVEAAPHTADAPQPIARNLPYPAGRIPAPAPEPDGPTAAEATASMPECKMEGCTTPAMDAEGWCIYHDPWTRNDA